MIEADAGDIPHDQAPLALGVLFSTQRIAFAVDDGAIASCQQQ
jgi:hypothetical protein